MSRYFSQERFLQEVKAYIERAETHMENDGYYEAQFDGFEEMQDDLFNLDTIDIVRCEDCKYKRQCRKAVEHITHEPTSVTIEYKSVGFCSYGEREGE